MRRDRRVAGPDAEIRMHGRAVSVDSTLNALITNDKCRVRYNIRPASDSPLID